MHKDSIAGQIWGSGESLILFHSRVVTDEILNTVIREERSMDLDIAVDESGAPYLGHSVPYYEKNNISAYDSITLEHALSLLEESPIPVHLDCKDYDAFTTALDFAERLGSHRCVLNSSVNELNFLTSASANSHMWGTYIEEEWMPIETLRGAKKRFPEITLQASGQGVTFDSLLEDGGSLLREIIHVLGADIDSVHLNIPSSEFVSKEVISVINDAGILYQVNIDDLQEEPQGLYIGESDDIAKTTAHFFGK